MFIRAPVIRIGALLSRLVNSTSTLVAQALSHGVRPAGRVISPGCLLSDMFTSPLDPRPQTLLDLMVRPYTGKTQGNEDKTGG